MALSASGINVELTSKAAILIDGETGKILYQKGVDELHHPASIGKIATALLVLETFGDDLDREVVVPREAVVAISSEEKKKRRYRSPAHWIEFGSSHVGLKVGEILSLESLLHGLMLQSGNDAANVLAYAVAGSIPAFIDQLNARVAELGCTATLFHNPHGLHHPDQVTSARDMAMIARAAWAHPAFRKIVGTTHYEKPATNHQPATVWAQKNRLIKKGKFHYPRAKGMKTGYTRDAKGTLVAAAEGDGRLLIAVFLRCSPFVETYRDAHRLFDAGFAYRYEEVVSRSPETMPISRRTNWWRWLIVALALIGILGLIYRPVRRA